MSWLLDTNVISEATKPRPSPHVVRWVASQPPQGLFTVSLAIAELRSGIERMSASNRRSELRKWLDLKVRPFFDQRIIEADEELWIELIEIQERAKRSRRTLPVTDLVFAAAGRRYDYVIVTRNTRHFRGSGVRALNPWHREPIVETLDG